MYGKPALHAIQHRDRRTLPLWHAIYLVCSHLLKISR